MTVTRTLTGPATGPGRFTLYQYGPMHWAIDCEPCDVKVADLTPNEITGTVIDKLIAHEQKWHRA